MRLDLGLDLPERRVGLTAHDFAQLLGTEEVILSHAAKIAGTPTVPSRFVQRLAAVAGAERWKAAIHGGEAYLSWARALDRPEHVTAAAQPAPKPPAAARPKRLSVTDIEDWLRRHAETESGSQHADYYEAVRAALQRLDFQRIESMALAGTTS